jgi:hypothetical protein
MEVRAEKKGQEKGPRKKKTKDQQLKNVDCGTMLVN